MATVAQIQAQLDPQGLNTKIVIVKQFTVSTTDTFYCTGGVVAPGKAKWVTTTNTDTAAQQATSITTGMTS
jgi:hypothetical protein